MCSPANTCESLQSMLQNWPVSHLLLINQSPAMLSAAAAPPPSSAPEHPNTNTNNQESRAPEILTQKTGSRNTERTPGKNNNLLLPPVLPGDAAKSSIQNMAPLMQFYPQVKNSKASFTAPMLRKIRSF